MTDATSPPEALAAWLAASPQGKRVWVRGLGNSLAPLVRSGDALQIERCNEERLARGDLAFGRVEGGGLTAHVVIALRPLRTASLSGALDPPLEVLGRAVSLERSGVRFPLLPGSRLVMRLLLRLVPLARRLRQRAFRFRRTPRREPW